jgi:hypothetical protein
MARRGPVGRAETNVDADRKVRVDKIKPKNEEVDNMVK